GFRDRRGLFAVHERWLARAPGRGTASASGSPALRRRRRNHHPPPVVHYRMVDWVILGTVATAVATLGLAVFSGLLLKINRRLAAIQSNAERRNDAILNVEQIQLLNDDNDGYVAERGVLFRVWNSGLKDTQIRDCYLEQRDERGQPERAELKFRRRVRTYEEVGPFMPTATTSPTEWHFVGEFLHSGEMWEVEAWLEEKRGIRTRRDPALAILPVLGHRKSMPIEDMMQRAIREGKARLEAIKGQQEPGSTSLT
ncbi:MAG: hypothetical protein ACRDGN_08700, partial [bacterium]